MTVSIFVSLECKGGLNYCCDEGNEVGFQVHSMMLMVMHLYMEVAEVIHMLFILI